LPPHPDLSGAQPELSSPPLLQAVAYVTAWRAIAAAANCAAAEPAAAVSTATEGLRRLVGEPLLYNSYYYYHYHYYCCTAATIPL